MTNPTSSYTYYSPVSAEPIPTAQQPLQTFPKILVRVNRTQPNPHNPLAGRVSHQKNQSEDDRPTENFSPANTVPQPTLANNVSGQASTYSTNAPPSKPPEANTESNTNSGCCTVS